MLVAEKEWQPLPAKASEGASRHSGASGKQSFLAYNSHSYLALGQLSRHRLVIPSSYYAW